MIEVSGNGARESQRKDTAWQTSGLTNAYLKGVRGAIPLAVEQIDIMIRLCHAARPDARLILDLGCGDGILGYALLDSFGSNNPRAVFADFSPPMLEVARSRTNSYDVRFVEVDYAKPGWVSAVSQHGYYDVIVSGFSIHHQPDDRKKSVYGEIFDLLAPGGVFMNLEHVSSASRWGEEQFEVYFIDSLYRFHAPHGLTREQVAVDFYHRPDKIANLLAPVDEQCEWLREIGFEKVDCYLKVFELALFGGVKPSNETRL